MTDQAFREWISYQPSCITKRYSEHDEKGDGRCVPCHVRRVDRGSGMGTKPEYSCVPMTFAEHMHQHSHGEADCLTVFKSPYHNWEEDEAAEWFEKEADRYLAKWEKQKK